MSAPVRIAVLASGRGSNFDAIHAAIQSGRLKAEIVGVVSDRSQAPVLEKARALGIPTQFVGTDSGKLSREQHDERVIEALRKMGGTQELPQFLIMAGYMRMVTPKLLAPFKSERGYFRVVNVHPSLLPAFPGKDSYRQAFEYGCHHTGVTVHLVDEKMDHGPICAQESFEISKMKSAEEVERAGLAIEHRLFSETLNWVLHERFSVEHREGRVCVRKS